MIRGLLNWFDDRTGYRHYLHHALYENVPGGARWRYVTGSMLVFAFTTQVVTGIFLWMCYSPSSQNAYESVYWIQNELQGGWLLRGIHHFMAHAMVVLLPMHFLQVVVDRAYRAPREFNFWTGLILMLITLGLSLTGYLLPWDQKGYWATKVATNLMTLAPGGEQMQKLVVGGDDYGHYTLTRFFALHAGVLPGLMVFFLMLHISLFRRHGITAEPSVRRPDQHFWPYQVFKDGAACLLLLAIVLVLVAKADLPGVLRGSADTAQLGADLGPPADAVEDYKAARPEWYFLFLFQLLKKFKSEFVGAIVVPSLIIGFMFLMPLIGRWRIGHALNVLVMTVLIIGVIYLTGEAIYEDHYSEYATKAPAKSKGEKALQEYQDRFKESRDYLAAVELGEEEYQRVRQLAKYYGIPRDGLMTLVSNDPEIQGRRLFRDKCAACHSYLDQKGRGIPGPESDPKGAPNGAPNLYNFATRTWLKSFLDPKGIVTNDYFGRTAHGQKDASGNYPSGGMVEFVHEKLVDLDDQGKKDLDDLVAALSAEAQLKSQQSEDAESAKGGAIERGKSALVERFACIDCHKFHEQGELGTAPELTGYRSLDWIKRMITNPVHEALYQSSNDRMPPFGEELSAAQIELLAKFIRGDERDLGK